MTEKGPSTTAASLHPPHVTVIATDDLGLRYWPSCSCGWSAYAQISHADAQAVLVEHQVGKGSRDA